MSLIQLLDFKIMGDERGSLISLEQNKNIPFEIKRIYYIYGINSNMPRGFHAHKELSQVAVCVKGSCEILMDDGNQKEKILLSTPSEGLIINPMQWHEMHNFSEDCVLLVLASDWYDGNDYIRDYDDFKKEISNAHSSIE